MTNGEDGSGQIVCEYWPMARERVNGASTMRLHKVMGPNAKWLKRPTVFVGMFMVEDHCVA